MRLRITCRGGRATTTRGGRAATLPCASAPIEAIAARPTAAMSAGSPCSGALAMAASSISPLTISGRQNTASRSPNSMTGRMRQRRNALREAAGTTG